MFCFSTTVLLKPCLKHNFKIICVYTYVCILFVYLALSYNFCNMWPSKSTFSIYPFEIHTYIQGDTYEKSHSSTIYISKKLKIVQMLIKSRMGKSTVVCLYNGILWAISIYNNHKLYGWSSQKNVEWKKSNTSTCYLIPFVERSKRGKINSGDIINLLFTLGQGGPRAGRGHEWSCCKLETLFPDLGQKFTL